MDYGAFNTFDVKFLLNCVLDPRVCAHRWPELQSCTSFLGEVCNEDQSNISIWEPWSSPADRDGCWVCSVFDSSLIFAYAGSVTDSGAASA